MTQHASANPSNRSVTINSHDRNLAGRRVGRDTRGVSEVIGTILMFGLLISLVVILQVYAVPVHNEKIEFEHNERVQQDLIQLDDEIVETGNSGRPGTTQVELAARYPARFFLLNPPVGAGSIETLPAGDLVISNAVSASADNYWNGDDRAFTTRAIRYRPNYNEFRNAPVTIYEHGTLVNVFDSATRGAGDGTFIDGNRITLVTIDGELSLARSSAMALETVPLSAPMQSLTVTNASGEKVELTLPTQFSAADWQALLEEQLVSNGGSIESAVLTPGTPHNTLTVTLAPGAYELRMARVGVSTPVGTNEAGPHYLAAVTERSLDSVRQGESTQVVVQVRDRFNNAARGEVTLTTTAGWFTTPEGSELSTYSLMSDDDGRVSAIFTPDSGFTGTALVNASGDFDESGVIEEHEKVQFSVTVEAPTDDRNDTNSVSGINPRFTDTVQLVDVKSNGSSAVDIQLYNDLSDPQTIREIRMLFYLTNDKNSSPATWGRVNGDPADQFAWLGDWEPVDSQTVTVPSKGTTWVTLEFNKQSISKDFVGITIEYDDTRGSYFVQVPVSNKP